MIPFRRTPIAAKAAEVEAIAGNLIGVAGRSPSRHLWRKNLVDQSIIRSFEWVDESDALQDEPILQIFSEQTPHPGTLRRSPQHRVPERQSVSSNSLKRGRKIVAVGRLYWEYSTPSIDRPS